MTDFLKLIRLPNLLIIALTQYLLRYFVLRPLLGVHGYSIQLGEVKFFLLVFSSVLIAAGGYIINDYFDTKVDRTNKPDRNVVGKGITRRLAMGLHIALNIIGISIGCFLAYHIREFWLAPINAVCAIVLWYYSTHFKHQPFTGNLIISLLAALVVMIVLLFELPLLVNYYNELNIEVLFAWFAGFSVFAFLTTLIREIIKDIEDIRGDLYVGSRTLPIVAGIKNAKAVLIVLVIFTFCLLVFVQSVFLNEKLIVVYLFLFIQAPLIFTLIKLLKKNSKKDYHLISRILKFVMVFGVLFSLLLWKKS